MEKEPEKKWWWKEGTTEKEKVETSKAAGENEIIKKFIDTKDIFTEKTSEQFESFKGEAGLIDTREIEERMELDPKSILNSKNLKEKELKKAEKELKKVREEYEETARLAGLSQISIEDMGNLSKEERQILDSSQKEITKAADEKPELFAKYQQKLHEVMKLKKDLDDLQLKLHQ